MDKNELKWSTPQFQERPGSSLGYPDYSISIVKNAIRAHEHCEAEIPEVTHK